MSEIMNPQREISPSTAKQASLLADGNRLYLCQGPIDLIIHAQGIKGNVSEVAKAYQQARMAFAGILDDLVCELELLRAPIQVNSLKPKGRIAQAMMVACYPHIQPTKNSPQPPPQNSLKGNHQGGNHQGRLNYITPMAAVAGAVADYVLEATSYGRDLASVYVNNGGDIAIFLTKGESFTVGICSDPLSNGFMGKVTIRDCDIRGIATSGWRGRSHSLGIADSVTIFAKNAAFADAAATMISGAIDLPGDCRIQREMAKNLLPDSDLREKLVTVNVGKLDAYNIELALEKGVRLGHDLWERGLIMFGVLTLQGRVRTVGDAQSYQQLHC